MAIKMKGDVGPQGIAAGDSAEINWRFGKTGEAVVQQLHGRYAEQSMRGFVYIASNVAAQAVSVALATTYTGLVISNPIGNRYMLSILGCMYALSLAPAAIASLHLIAGYSATAQVTHTTPLAAPGIQNGLIGIGEPSSAKADSAATISTPNYLAGIGSGFTAAALYATTPSWIDLSGLITIPPGGFIAVGALTAVTGFATFAWEEVAMPI